MLSLMNTNLTANGTPVYSADTRFPDYPVVPSTAINAYSVLSIPAYWRAMTFLSTNLASFPRSVHKDGAKQDPEETPHPLARLLRRRPNACQNATIFWRTLFFHAAHRANGYAEIVRDGARPASLLNKLPDDVCPFRYDLTAEEREWVWKTYNVRLAMGAQQYYLIRSERRVVTADNMIHIQALGYDGMTGMDGADVHAETFQRASTLNRYQTKYLQKGTVIRGAVEIPAGTSPEQDQQIVETIKRFFTGPDAERDIIVLSDGAKLNNATLSPQQSQLVEQGAQVTKEIAQLTGVPPQFLYEFAESKYNNSIEQMGQDVVRYTFRPWIEQTEDELTTKLLSDDDQDAGYTVRINPGALLRGSTKEQEEIVAASVNAGIRTRNEGRRLLDLPPDDAPDSDRLKVLGDTSPNGAPGAPPTPPSDGDREQASADATPAQRLNGYHVTAALRVLRRLKAGQIGTVEAAGLLAGVGIPRDEAEAMAAAASVPAIPQPGDPHPGPGFAVTRVTAEYAPGDAAKFASVENAGPWVPTVDPYAALAPVIAAACERVDRKSDKAFEHAAKKAGPERTVHFNVFAEEQARYATDALAPVEAALAQLGVRDRIDVARVAERYAAGIRKRAATGEVVRLADLIG